MKSTNVVRVEEEKNIKTHFWEIEKMEEAETNNWYK